MEPQENPLMPPMAPSGPDPSLGQSGAANGPDPLDPLHHQNSMASAQLKKLDEAATLMRKTREELDVLLDLGDLVDEHDIVRSVSKIVAAGGSPMALASMLADAPFGNKEALQAWVAQRDQGARAMEQQLEAARIEARHQAAVSGLKLLAGHSAQQMATSIHAAAAPPAEAAQPPVPGPSLGQAPAGPPPGPEQGAI
jgi:hypothetical protein